MNNTYTVIDIESTGLNSFTDRIVLIGVSDYNGNQVIYESKNEDALLDRFMLYVERDMRPNNHIITTYNGSSFDVPFIVARALHHGFTGGAQLLKLRHLDLMWIVKKYMQTQRYRSPTGQLKLTSIAKFLGIDVPEDDFSGKDVPILFEAGKIQPIIDHCKIDLQITLQMLKEVKDIADMDIKLRYPESKEHRCDL